ncbi:glycosyltransferase [Actinomyces israelii]|uniref:glycosyltransferase n=1 Tax=Actinomyces israelii TaxID=1659 RepID=UPI0025549158|nr:glycosyltransferase [Actinomyces israelii]WKR20938.1 Galactofuranosyltransferase GlfT2 [Actinomyces israelii]
MSTTTRVLQRFVLPADGDSDILPLYAEGEVISVAPVTKEDRDDETAQIGIAETTHQSPGQIVSRYSYRIPAQSRSSFGTYFNAFPAAYWRRWTIVERVILRVTVSGSGSVIVYKSNARGASHRVDSARIAPEPSELVFELSLNTFGDGGWYWFDVAADSEDAVVEAARWEAQVPAETPRGRATIGITTYNRPTDCATVLGQLGASDTLPEVLKEVVVVDQGSKKVVDDDRFPAARESLGAGLRVINQPNLGGSGGFSRGMYEAMEGGTDYVLLLDDDVRVDPEGIVRAVAFADLARVPTIVGGHMFSMYERTMLHAYAEHVQPWRFWWGAVKGTRPDHDLATAPLRTTAWLHQRADADYNGWWMCLIPTSVVRRIGLSLPFFIKWDDSEYGLRARGAGVPTVSFPGAAVWHVPWTDKDDSLDWQAYFHERNRLVAALIHSQYKHGGHVVTESMQGQIKHLLSSQYSVVELRLRAIEDILTGPGHLQAGISTIVPRVRALRSDFDDALVEKDPDAFPEVRREKLPRRGEDLGYPKTVVGRIAMAAKGSVKQILPVKTMSLDHPEARVPWSQARWWMLSQFDSAIVSNSDGSGASWYHRDPARFRELLVRSIVLHRRLRREWEELHAEYQASVGEVVSPEAWARTFGIAGNEARPDVVAATEESR